MRVELSPRFQSDFLNTVDYLEHTSLGLSLRFKREVLDKIVTIGMYPMLYQVRPEYGPAIRAVSIGRYTLFYRVIGETVRVERIRHGTSGPATM